jgi:hypothetical protein
MLLHRRPTQDTDKQKDALQKAKEAAQQGDPIGFLEHLHRSRFLDGAKRWLSSRYEGFFDEGTLDDILSTSSDLLYRAASERKDIHGSASYLFKIIDNAAKAKKKDLALYEDIDGVDPMRADGLRVRPAQEGIGEERLEEEEREWEEVKKDGIRIARSLLPRIGEDNVQRVMGYIIDVVERGAEDVTNHEIAEALMLSPVSVRKWKQRGFERLRRAAKEAGYRKDILDHVAPEPEASDNEDE